jgi:hypothetical protein
VASLFNASCLAADFPDVLAMIPNIALQITNPPTRPANLNQPNANTLAPSNIQLSGHHYFSTNTTPVFELDSASAMDSHLGVVIGKKNANSTAPVGSAPSKYGGTVPWLFLDATNKSETATPEGNIRIGADVEGNEWKGIYRLLTAGGAAPKTCDGVATDENGVFSVEYASVYYFYKGS